MRRLVQHKSPIRQAGPQCRHGRGRESLPDAGLGGRCAQRGPEGSTAVDAALGEQLPVVPAAASSHTRPTQPAPARTALTAQVGCFQHAHSCITDACAPGNAGPACKLSLASMTMAHCWMLDICSDAGEEASCEH